MLFGFVTISTNSEQRNCDKNIMNYYKFDNECLKEWTGRFLLSIQVERDVDLLAAQEVISRAKELARALKGCELVPRDALKELHMTKKILRAEIPYLKNGADEVIKVADEIEFIFDLILLGECCEDRVPGVPRII